MLATRSTTFRIYPNQAQTTKLFEWRRLHCWLYNQALSDRQIAYKRDKKSVSYYAQQRAVKVIRQVLPEFKELGSHALQATIKRVNFAYQRFFHGLGKYPRFKSLRHYSGWTYPCTSGWKTHTAGVNGYLDISNLGKIQMRGKARTWGNPTTLTIVCRNGKWYASITVTCDVQRETSTGAIGLDFGCLSAVAMSDGTLIKNPKFLAKTQEIIKKVSKVKRRKRAPNYQQRIKGSNRWKKTQKRISKLQRKVAESRQDWIHKVAAQIVSSNSMVATEKLNLKNLTKKAKKGSKRKRQKTGLNRSILDVGIGMLRSAIQYKIEEAGGFFVEVPTQKVKPSQTCPNCGHQKEKSLKERLHSCEKCGYTGDRDVVAAQVMLNWATGSAAYGTCVGKHGCSTSISSPKVVKNCGGLKQVGQKKCQKPRPSF